MSPARKPAKKAVRKTAPTQKPDEPGVDELRFMVESAFERRTTLTPEEMEGSTRPVVERVIEGIENGEFRVAEPDGKGGWQVNEWLKKAVLLYFRTQDMEVIESYPAPFWDKIPARFGEFDESAFRKLGVRVVPGAIVRRGAHIGKDVVLMPSFVNIGAHVGAVLEPLQATPTIIEDHCFIGARSEVVEGFVVGHHSVIGMGVFLGQSTRIYNRATGEVSYGSVPPYSVVVSGQLPASDGSHSLYCAVIVKQVDARTRSKTSVNDLLRGLAD